MKKAIISFISICLICFLSSCGSYERREAYKFYSDRDGYYTVNCTLSYRELGQNTTPGYSSYVIQIDDITAYNDGKLPPLGGYSCGIPLKSANEAVENGFEFKQDDRIYQITFSIRMFGDGWPCYVVGISCDDTVYLNIDNGIENLLEQFRD